MSVVLTLKVVLIDSFSEKNVTIFYMLFSTVADHLVTVAMVT